MLKKLTDTMERESINQILFFYIRIILKEIKNHKFVHIFKNQLFLNIKSQLRLLIMEVDKIHCQKRILMFQSFEISDSLPRLIFLKGEGRIRKKYSEHNERKLNLLFFWLVTPSKKIDKSRVIACHRSYCNFTSQSWH